MNARLQGLTSAASFALVGTWWPLNLKIRLQEDQRKRFQYYLDKECHEKNYYLEEIVSNFLMLDLGGCMLGCLHLRWSWVLVRLLILF